MTDKRSGKTRRQGDADIVKLQDDLENHIQDSHTEFERIRESQSVCKNDIMDEITKYHDDIKPILERERDIEGAYRTGKRLQNFVQYWVKWPIIIAGILAIIRFVLENWHRLIEHLTNGH